MVEIFLYPGIILSGRYTLGPLRCWVPAPAALSGAGRGVQLVAAPAPAPAPARCPDLYLEFQLLEGRGSAAGLLYQLRDPGTQLLCELRLTSRRGLRYSWRSAASSGLVTNLSLALADTGLGDGRWHALQLEHNMMEVSLTTVMELSNIYISNLYLHIYKSRYLQVSLVLDRETVASHTHTQLQLDNQPGPGAAAYYRKVGGCLLSGKHYSD